MASESETAQLYNFYRNFWEISMNFFNILFAMLLGQIAVDGERNWRVWKAAE